MNGFVFTFATYALLEIPLYLNHRRRYVNGEDA
jgi:hypothetical protein